jgi:hypothetical protein
MGDFGFKFSKRRQLIVGSHNETLLARHIGNRRLCLTSDTTNCIRNALPIVPFTFRDERVDRFEDLPLTKFRNQLFKLLLNLTSHRCAKFRRDAYLSRAVLAF